MTQAMSLAGAAAAAAGLSTPNRLLAQDQEFDAQEWPFEPGPRKVKMWIQEPERGVNANTGLMLVLHNWGGFYTSPEYVKWCKTFADRYNVVAVSVNYLQSGEDWKRTEGRLPYDHGYLQAMDCLGALYHVRRQLKAQGAAFNDSRIYSMGGSGGGNVTQMVMKLAPRAFACGVDICGMPGLTDNVAYGLGQDGCKLNAGYSRDPASPCFLSVDMQEIRDFGHVEHNRIRFQLNPSQKIVIVHGVADRSCSVVRKIDQFQRMVALGMDVDGHFLTEWHVDGVVVTTTGHKVGDREQVVVRFADEYLLENGRMKKSAPGPSDFALGGEVVYPTTNGKFVIDYKAYPVIRFEKR
ncbi:MAG TPA: DUF2920 family protein [Candidatus Brocadiia bacterium]|nr:DUF2920 family protein [Candidatus Brocadiia bacterium]